MIDEIDAVAGDPECKALLAKIASKCRSEGVALVIAGQRATVQWMGGGDLRANVDIAVLGRFARAGEARKATGEEVDVPDMGAYGEGHPGVFLVTELGGGGGYDRGRVFKLSEPEQLDRIVADRLARQRPYVPEPGFARMAKLWAQITGAHPRRHRQHRRRPRRRRRPGPRPRPGPGRRRRRDRRGHREDRRRPPAGRAGPRAGRDPAGDARQPPRCSPSGAASSCAEYADIDIPADELATITEMLARPEASRPAAVAEAARQEPHDGPPVPAPGWRSPGTPRSGASGRAAPDSTPRPRPAVPAGRAHLRLDPAGQR